MCESESECVRGGERVCESESECVRVRASV